MAIYFPALKVVHTGDLFTNGSPFIDYASHGSVVEWTKTLDGIMNSGWDFDTVIPGHGPVSKPADVKAYIQKFDTMRTRVTGLVRDGKGKDEVSKTLVGDFGWAPTGLGIAQVDGMIAELKR